MKFDFKSAVKREKWIFLAVCLTVVFLIYGRTLGGDFVFDDRGIAEHKNVLSFGKLPLVLGAPYWSAEAGLYRPVTLATYALNFSFLGQKPWGFHLINLILYALCGWQMKFLLEKLFGGRKLLSWGAVLLFLTLPIHSEAVANIVGRAEILALLFSLLALDEFAGDRRDAFRFGLYFLLAMGSKETAVAVVPLALWVALIKEKKVFDLTIWRRYLIHFGALAAAGLIYFGARLLVLGRYFMRVETTLVENQLQFVSYGERLATSLKIFLVVYLKKMVWPFDFCADYSFAQIEVARSFGDWPVLNGLAVVLLLIAGSVAFLRRWPVAAFGCAFMFFGFLPTSNWVLPVGTIAGERLAFFPSVGFCLLIAGLFAGVARLAGKKWCAGRGIFLTAAFLFLTIFWGWRSYLRGGDWLTERQLFAATAVCAPRSVLSRSNLGAAYYLAGDLVNAKKELLAAREIYDGYPKGINNLGLVYWKEDDNDRARDMFLRALDARFPYWGACENLALVSLEEGKIAEAREWLLKFYSGDEMLADAYLKAAKVKKN